MNRAERLRAAARTRLVRPTRPSLRRIGAALAFALALPACGAKTGLREPEIIRDAGMDVEFTRFDACVMGRFPLVRRSAEMFFVFDRSGSMNEALNEGGDSRWRTMVDVLRESLPRYEAQLEMGAMFYPREVCAMGASCSSYFCQLRPPNAVQGDPLGIDVTIGGSRARAISSAFGNAGPFGGTPTGIAIRRATEYLRSREARGRAQYIVLATDGAPNCNGNLDPFNPASCTCLAGDQNACQVASDGARLCLDDVASIDAVRAAAQQSIFTYVIGIDGDIPDRFRRVLDDMAVAGQRARPQRPGETRYYSIQDVSALRDAFDTIQNTLARCAFVTPSRPDNPDSIDIDLGGRRIQRDATRREGWDWTDRDYGEITFYGAACDAAAASPQSLTATVRCGQ